MEQAEIERKASLYKSAAIALVVFGAFGMLIGVMMWGALSPGTLTTAEISSADSAGVGETIVDKMIEMKVAIEMTEIIGMICTIVGIVGIGAGIGIDFIAKDLRKKLK